jgi:hypothetical protein
MQCPTCGCDEEHPTRTDRILIRGCKVFDDRGCYSQCLVCAGYYNADLTDAKGGDPEKGWFVE